LIQTAFPIINIPLNDQIMDIQAQVSVFILPKPIIYYYLLSQWSIERYGFLLDSLYCFLPISYSIYVIQELQLP